MPTRMGSAEEVGMSSTTPRPPSRATREEYDAWYEQCRAQCPPGASLPAYDPPRELPTWEGRAEHLDLLTDALDAYGLQVQPTISDQKETHGVYIRLVVDGIPLTATAHRCESADQAAHEVIKSLGAWLDGRVCDVCLGAKQAPDADYRYRIVTCGSCFDGDGSDDGEPPLTMAEREHEARRLAR